MHRGSGRRAGVAGAVLAVLGTVGCAAHEDIGVTNAAGTTVTVRVGHEDLGEVTSGGGVVLLDPDGCYDGPVVVTYPRGGVVTLDGPLCPGQTLAVGDATARIVDAESAD